ncbi:hypothetical protein BJX99DRAFT_248745 [Aspergillus californicus]
MATTYEAVHKTPNGPGDARPTAVHIIHDEQLVGKWTDKTPKQLFEPGATIFATARDLNKAKSALSSIIDSNRVHLLQLDLESLASVRTCAENFLARSDGLNVLITNAGVMATPEGRTVDGFETQFGTNHLAHFLLIQLLLPALQKSSKPGFQSRVIVLSSVAHRDGEVNFAGPVHPGGIMTGLMKHFSEEQKQGLGAEARILRLMKTPEQGAATTIWAATAKVHEGQGGKYLEDCQVAKPPKAGASQYDPGYSAWAYDEKKATQLWER